MRSTVARKPFRRDRAANYIAIGEYLGDIFALSKPSDGQVCFRSGVGSYAAQSWLSVDKLGNLDKELSRHDVRDAYFSFATYRGGRNASRRESEIANIFAWSEVGLYR